MVLYVYEVEIFEIGVDWAVSSSVMFTPQRVRSGWPLTPKTGGQKGGAGSAANPSSVTPSLSRRGDGIKGKSVTPLSDSIVENRAEMFVGSAEAAALDQEGLAEKISKLENEVS